MRNSDISRKTSETDILLKLELDGEGKADVESGCGFLDHMLSLFAVHGSFDLYVRCSGDTNVDYHHTVEDIAICLGNAFRQSLGDRKGITRYGDSVIPMDEALIMSAVDISGRGGFYCDISIPTEKVGDFDTELVEEFMTAFSRNSGICIHIRQLAGRNSHHIIEGIFKSIAHSIKTAVALDPLNSGRIPSSKGMLE